MQAPVHLTFRGMAPSASVEAAVSAWMERLTHVFDRIQRCHVWVDIPHHHRQRGALVQVTVTLTVPGGEIVTRQHSPDAYVALGEAFLAARRQLQARADIQRDGKHPSA